MNRTAAGRPAALVIARQECTDLWLGSKGLAVAFGYSLLLGLLAYASSSNASVNLLDARESVGIVVQVAIALGALAALVISADAISGERERGTLEALLVTPAARRDLVLGKLIAATSMWVCTLSLAVPFVVVLAEGPGVTVDAVAALLIAGATVAAALTALGLAVSAVAHSNRTSLAASMSVLLVLATPSQLPAVAHGPLRAVLVKANPVSAGLELAENVIVRQQAWSEQGAYLISPVLSAVALTTIAVLASRRLQLGGAR